MDNVKERRVVAPLCIFCELEKQIDRPANPAAPYPSSLGFVCDDISMSRDLGTWLAGTLDNFKLRSGYNDHPDPQALRATQGWHTV